MLNGLRSDLAAAVRSLFKNPSYTVFAVICLALGMGATTAVFSVVNAFLLRPLPFEDPSRLINIWMTAKGTEQNRYFVDAQMFTELQDLTQGFEVAGVQPVDLNLSLEAEPRRVQGYYATSNFFDLLGVPLLQGRSFSSEEERREEKVCVVSEEFWRGQMGSRPDLLQSKMLLGGVEHRVVGIARRGSFPEQSHIWIPVTQAVRQGRYGFTVIGRMGPGTSLSAVNQQLKRLTDYFRKKDPVSNAVRGLAAGDLNGTINQRGLDENLWALLGVVGFLLAIACANLAALLLVRLHNQRPELAVRSALGAGRSRLLRRILIESSLLALLGALLGVGLAYAVTPALVAMSPAELPRFRELGVDGRVLGFAAALTIATLLCFSILPAWRAARADPSVDLGRGGRGRVGSLSFFQRLLAVADVGLALVLLAGAGLMLTSFWRLSATSAGFDPKGLYRVRLVTPASWAQTHQGRTAFIREVEERLTALPGVEEAGSSHSFPIGGIQYWLGFLLEDRPQQTIADAEMGLFQIVTPGFFNVMQMHPLRGRLLKRTDVNAPRRVAVVSEAFAEQYWPGGDPLGKRMRQARSHDKNAWWTIVGVVPDQKDRGLAEGIGPSIYFAEQLREPGFTPNADLFVRTKPGFEGTAAAIRQGIRSVDPDALLYDMAPMTEVMAETLQQERFSAVLTTILAGLALTLAGAGVYGVISYGISRRRGELGVRMAFGARGSDLTRLVVGQSLKGVLAGIAAGNLAALGLGRLIASQLYQTQPNDPLMLAAASALILATAFAASYLPARRTSKLDPTEALRV